VLFISLLGFATGLRAHTPNETYLTLVLTGTNLVGHWDVARKDLQQGLILGLDASRLTTLPPAELEARQEALALDVLARLTVKADGTLLPLKASDYLSVSLNNGDYLSVRFEAPALRDSPRAVELDARILFTLDPSMHGLLRLEHDGRTETVSFNNEHPNHLFELFGPANRWGQWLTFVREGVWHIWSGPDHILFLIALLLPSVLRRENGTLKGVNRFRSAFVNVVKIVTAFTLAHSLTLSLAALSVVQLPLRLVESVIALSVALAALNNLRPVVVDKGWIVAFGFGLVHGFGFAVRLGELGLGGGILALALVGFNVGVEIGQLCIVMVFFPFAFAARGTGFYQFGVLKLGSALVTVIAAVWMVQRLLGIGI
jgi:hypothetical protein